MSLFDRNNFTLRDVHPLKRNVVTTSCNEEKRWLTTSTFMDN